MNETQKRIWKLYEKLTEKKMPVDLQALDRIYTDDIMVTPPLRVCGDKPAVMKEVRQVLG